MSIRTIVLYFFIYNYFLIYNIKLLIQHTIRKEEQKGDYCNVMGVDSSKKIASRNRNKGAG